MPNRRDFLIASAAATGSLGIGLAGCGAEKREPMRAGRSSERESAGLEILILGGTGFIGPHMVRRAELRGHTVTLFNRGRSNADLFPDIETLIGDRDSQLDALAGRRWDAVIDNSGYVPRHVRESAELLSDAVAQYLFISSISAYTNFEVAGIDEEYALGTMPDETVEDVTAETYGPMKALAEKAVVDAFPDTATIVRPGFIVGPRDNTDRWTYWPLRVRAGGEMLAPGMPDDPVQFIDARDLARFVIRCVENGTCGTYNAVGPAERLAMGPMLRTMKDVTASDTSMTWVDAATLDKHGVSLPIWAAADSEYFGAHLVSNARAIAAGMTYTPLDDTVRDTLAWWDALPADRRSAMRSGLRIGEDGTAAFGSTTMSLADQMAAEAKLLESLSAA